MKVLIKEKRLSHIIDSAESIFFEKGYNKASVSDICKLANCSRTTFYSHFESRENIYLAVVNKSFKKFLQFFSSLDMKGKEGMERIITLSEGYLRFSKESPKNYQMILDFYTILKNVSNSKLKSHAYTLLTECSYFEKVHVNAKLPIDLLVDIIKAGQEDKSINSKVSAQVLLINIWAYLIGVTNLAGSSKQDTTISILGINMKDWEKNTLSVIEKMLT